MSANCCPQGDCGQKGPVGDVTALKSMVGIRPIGKYIFIQRDPAVTKTPGGIELPDRAIEKVARGTVVAVGPGEYSEASKGYVQPVSVGDRVLLTPYADTIELDGHEYIVTTAESLYAVLT
jgi:chaperonin GroES